MSNLRASTDWFFDLEQVSSSLYLSFFTRKKNYVILQFLTMKNYTLLKTTVKTDFQLHGRGLD